MQYSIVCVLPCRGNYAPIPLMHSPEEQRVQLIPMFQSAILFRKV